jgi:hypothetical protein
VICLLTAVEVKRWEWHGQAPSQCSRRKHSHVTDAEAEKLVAEGSATLRSIHGRRCLVPLNIKKPRPMMSAGYVVLQLVDV